MKEGPADGARGTGLQPVCSPGILPGHSCLGPARMAALHTGASSLCHTSSRTNPRSKESLNKGLLSEGFQRV